MIRRLSNKILLYLLKNNAIDNDEKQQAFYSYSIEITISSMLNIFIILMLSVITHSFVLGITFLLTFIPIRQFTGGYHAKTYFRCNSTFAICYILTLIICKTTYSCPMVVSTILFIAELLFVISSCPIANANKPIDSIKQYQKLKTISISLYLIYWIIGMYLFKYQDIKLGYMIICTLYTITVLGIVTKFMKGEKNNEEVQ